MVGGEQQFREKLENPSVFLFSVKVNYMTPQIFPKWAAVYLDHYFE